LTPCARREQNQRVIHADHRVALPDTSYFVIGNGEVRAAVQFAAGGDGTPLGLIVDDPARPGAKREAPSMSDAGLEATSVRIRIGDLERAPALPNLSVRWESHEGPPVVVAFWGVGDVSVRDRFFVEAPPSRRVVREITLLNDAASPLPLTLLAGAGRASVSRSLIIGPQGQATAVVMYELATTQPAVGIRFADPPAPDPMPPVAQGLVIATGDDLLDHACRAATRQLPAVTPRDGAVPGELWSSESDDVDATTGAASTVSRIRGAMTALTEGRAEEVSELSAWLADLAGARAGTWFSHYGDDGEPEWPGAGDVDVSVRAWTEILRLVVEGLFGVRPGDDGVHIRPRLLPGVERMAARLRIRAMTLHLDVVADASAADTTDRVVPYGTGDVRVTIAVPPTEGRG